MTISEAKRILYVFRSVILVDASHIEAFDMAIKALEQEPCEDAISRQAVLEQLDVYCKSNCKYTEAEQDVMCRACDTGSCIELIENMPSVTPARPKGEWISPKIALPEEDSFVLVTINARGRRRVRSSFYMNKLFMNDNGDTWRATDKHLVAWMYSPEPCGTETELKKKVNK